MLIISPQLDSLPDSGLKRNRGLESGETTCIFLKIASSFVQNSGTLQPSRSLAIGRQGLDWAMCFFEEKCGVETKLA